VDGIAVFSVPLGPEERKIADLVAPLPHISRKRITAEASFA
jgi:hypothetical protein